MIYQKNVWVNSEQMSFMRRCLNEQPAAQEDTLMGKDDALSVTADFGNGIEMDVKVCGVQFREGEDNRAWSEAVLFKDGCEVGCTEPSDEIDGAWALVYDGNIYFAVVKELPPRQMTNEDFVSYICEAHGDYIADDKPIESDGLQFIRNILNYFSKHPLPPKRTLETLVELFDGLGIEREELSALAMCDTSAEASSEDIPEPIYTRDEAAGIVELFEDILDENAISIPSPEDDQRTPDNMIGMYGSTYYDLLDGVEATLQELLERHTPDTEVIHDEFSGTA